jgi:hypothetical protein
MLRGGVTQQGHAIAGNSEGRHDPTLLHTSLPTINGAPWFCGQGLVGSHEMEQPLLQHLLLTFMLKATECTS